MALLQKSQLSDKQERAIDRLFERDTTILIGNTGLGKTTICLTAIAELIQSNVLKRVVVTCPAKVVANWPKEAAKWDHLKHLRVVALDGDAGSRLAKMSSPADVFVTSLNNFDWFAAQKHDCDGVVVDELSKACGKQTKALKAKKGDCFKWRVGMTATPVSENFQKLYDMCRIMDGGAALGTNKQRYLATYFMSDYMGYNYTLLPNADKAIISRVKHLIYMVKDEKASELPPIEYKTIEFDMPEETQAIYKQMKKDMVVGDVEAVNAAVKSGKLRQIGSGFLYDEDGKPEVLDRVRAGLATCEVLKDREPLVIFYEHDAHYLMLADLLSGTDHHMNFRCITGGMNKKTADQFINDFKDRKALTLIAQINAMSHGVDGLQDVCSHALFYHPMWSRDATEQAVGRIWRTGQKKPVTITTLVCRQSLDPLVMARVDKKGDFMKLFKRHLNEQ